MQWLRSFRWSRLLTVVTFVLIWKVTVSVVIEYRNYFPPNFESTFLLGRETYFWGSYRWAFYVHLLSGPLTLVVGTLLVSRRFRLAVPKWHRRLGRLQVVCVLFFVAPSGLWMSFYAVTGPVAGSGLGLLALVTAVCVSIGWRAAVTRRFDDHQRWMMRTFVLLCSAVVIRMMGGLAEVMQFDAVWLYPVSVWTSWIVPLLAFETYTALCRDSHLSKPSGDITAS